MSTAPLDKPANANAQAAPCKRGDIIACGVFDGSNGQSVCWTDYVSDELLYAISQGAKGWATARTEPARFSDKMKARKIDDLQKYVYSHAVLGVSSIGVGGRS